MISIGVRTDSLRFDRALIKRFKFCCPISPYDTILSKQPGISQVQETLHYIERQLEHHRTRTFQEEYLAFLKQHGSHFDEKYLWD